MCALAFSALAHAASIEVDFISAEMPTGPGSTVTIPTDLPALLGGNADAAVSGYAGDTLFLKFKVPAIGQVVAINSFSVTFQIADDEQDAGETAELDFALPGNNIILDAAPFTNGKLSQPPPTQTFTYNLTPAEISQVFPTISDGNFRLRIMRETGDFDVIGGSAVIDATAATPEPASVVLLACGLGIVAIQRRAAKAARR